MVWCVSFAAQMWFLGQEYNQTQHWQWLCYSGFMVVSHCSSHHFLKAWHTMALLCH